MFLPGSGLEVEFLRLSLSLVSAPLCLLHSGSPVLRSGQDTCTAGAAAYHRGMRVSASGTTSVEGLKSPEMMLGTGSLEAAATLMTSYFDDLQLAIERMYLCHDVEDTGVGLMVVSDLGHQSPIVRVAGQVNGLMVGR